MSRALESGEMGWSNGPLFAMVDPNDKATLLEHEPEWSIRWLPRYSDSAAVSEKFICYVRVADPVVWLEFHSFVLKRDGKDARLRRQQEAFRELARETAQRLREGAE